MDPLRAGISDVPVTSFEDGLGRRYRAKSDGERQLEILCFHAELTEIPSFEFSLRERVNRLAAFQHASYARIAKVDRLKDGKGTLALFSEFIPGIRLAELIAETERRGLTLDVTAALSIVQQLATAAAALQQNAHMANGALAPERVIVTPQGRPIILEFVVGVALEQLKYSRERYWRDLRVALPPAGGLLRFDQYTDAVQLGMITLALLLGRLIRADEFPDGLEPLLAAACSRHAHDGRAALMPQLRVWLRRTLQLDPRNSFKTIFEVKTELDTLLSGEDTTHALTNFLARYHGSPAPMPSGLTPIRSSAAPHLETFSAGTEDEEDESTDADSEEWPMGKLHSTRRRFSRRAWLAAGLVLSAMAGVLFASQGYFSSQAVHVATGTLAVTTDPAGADVTVDGEARGRTPMALSLPAGPHNLVVKGDGEPRTIPITIIAGTASAQYVVMPKTAAETGVLQIWSEPSGARVVIDGQQSGTTPLAVHDLTAGEHSVVLENDIGAVTHTVTITPGVPASLVVPMAAPQNVPVSGWIAVTAPVEMQLYEQGRLLGTTSVDRLMLSTGRHDIEIVSEPLAYRATRNVQVFPGRVSTIAVSVPNGVVSLNAKPWANVFMDGQSLGETPIGNLSVPIGPHEFTFSNPQLGDQRRAIMVTLREPARVSVDLTKK